MLNFHVIFKNIESHKYFVMETRSRTTKLIVKNVEMLENQKFDKFDKVIQWLETLHDFEYNQHQKDQGNSSNQQNLSSRIEKNDDFFDSDSSVNTGEIFFSL